MILEILAALYKDTEGCSVEETKEILDAFLAPLKEKIAEEKQSTLFDENELNI